MSGSFPRRALISVSDKTGLAELAKGLNELGFEIVSTGGTRAFLQQQGAKVIDIAEYTGFPEIMDGRVKTLHPKVHGAILGRPTVPHHAEAIAAHGIIPFELVVVNLYPFEATIAKPGCTTEDAIENIDIGGPSMVRSAAKNHEHLGIVTCPSQYERVLTELRTGKLSHTLRCELAAAAFACTARYDRAIADYMAGMVGKLVAEEFPDGVTVDNEKFPRVLHLDFERRMPLRYGENPHQAAAFFVERNADATTLAAFEKLHGKELSYNNLLDLDSANGLLYIATEFVPAVKWDAVMEHATPAHRIRVACGVICQVLDALEYAHTRSFVHRDIKPSNVLVRREGRRLVAKLSDFGLAKRYADAGLSQLTRDGDVLGSLAYMSPEQFIDSRHAKPPYDIYATGATLYRLLTGHDPFVFAKGTCKFRAILEDEPVPLRKSFPQVPAALADIVHRALAKHPSDRFASAAEMRHQLLPFGRR